MKRFKNSVRIVAAFMCIALVFVLCSCSENGGDKTEVTKLKMILVGDKPAIFDEIYGKINEMMREDIGAELDIEYYNFSDLKQKYSLLFSSGEEFDIVFSADWQQYNQQASKNSFMEITDEMLKKNAPKTYETLTETQKKEAMVNGKMYMVPNTAREYSNYVVLIRGDLREKYGMDKLETLDDFEKYLTAVAENESNIIPLVDLIGMGLWNDEATLLIPKSTELEYAIGKDEFIKRNFVDNYVTSVKRTREFVDKKIIPSDVSVNKSISSMFENGKAATYIKNLETSASLAKKLRSTHPEWKVEICDFSQGKQKIANASISNGLSLSRTTKNADKALQAIELLRNDKRYFDLTWYGVEGKHWKADGENGYISLNADLPADQKYEPGCVWGWKNEAMLRVDSNEIPEKKEILERWYGETIESDIYGFTLDDSSIKTELATITSAASQYGGPLYSGMIPMSEIDAAIKQYREKLEQAGMEKVYDEVVKQYKEYKNNSK